MRELSATSCLFMYTYHDDDDDVDAGWKWEEISEASLWNLQLSWQ